MVYTQSMSFEGWSIGKFLKGRKHLIVTVVSGLVGYVTTNSPMYAGIAAAAGELVVALAEYYIKKEVS